MTIAEKLVTIADKMEKIHTAGQENEYNRFWDAFQNNGVPMLGDHMFAGKMWNDTCYYPKYPIVLSSCTNMYRDSLITDTKVDIDISRCSNSSYCFNNAEKLVCIRKIITSENVKYTGWFAYDRNIEEIRFEGIIGKSLDIHYSINLSAESYESILDCLSTTSVGQILTLPTTAETTYDAKYGSGAWAEKINRFTNWEIKYS